MNIIKCRFLDKDGEPRTSSGDNEGTKKVLCVAVNVPEEEIAPFRSLVKTAVGVHTTDDLQELTEQAGSQNG